MPSQEPAASAASVEDVIAGLHIEAQSDYGRGWNSALDAAIAALRHEGLTLTEAHDGE